MEAEAGPGSEGEEERDFIKSAKWAGSKKGFVFKTGPRGLGYYRDKGGAKGAAGAGKRQVEGGKKKLPGRLRKKLAKERGRG